MSPWTEKTGPVWPLYAGMALLVVAAAAGLLLLTGVVDSDDTPPAPRVTPSVTPSGTPTPDRPSPSASAAPAPAPGDGLRVVSWGQARGQLALVVRNTSARTVEQARVRITATDASGAVLLATTGRPGDVCCTVTGLTPGADVALFADPVPRAADVRAVAVDALSLDAGPATPTATVRAGAPTLRRLPGDTVVTAGLVARGDLDGYVAAQAVLVDARGRVAQVISGRFYCFAPGRARTVRLHLFHAVPAGLRVSRVLAQPVPAGAPGVVPGRCG